MRAFRRIARIVHPDKCQHPLAKEAFQILIRSSKNLKTCNGNTLYSTYLIRIIIKASAAATSTSAFRVAQQANFFFH